MPNSLTLEPPLTRVHESSTISALEAVLNELNSTPLGRRAFLASVPLLMAACASSTKTRYREGDNIGQETQITVDDEKRMTTQYLTEMKKDYPPVKDVELQAYVSQVGNRIVAANGLGGKPYHYNFTLVDVAAVNAFALPAGTIFVTAPLLTMADTEAELAGVIGHEIGHVKARHAAERIEMQQRDSGKSIWYGLGGGALGAAAGFGLGKILCTPNDRDCLEQATKMGAVAGVAGGLLIQKYKFMANSREDEMEADRIGFKTAVQGGYSARHVGIFYEKLQKMEERRKGGDQIMASLADALSTHPPSRERIAQMKEMESQTAADARATVSTVSFDRARAKVEKLIKEKPKA